VAWHQSAQGKWYLIEVFKRGSELEADHRDFHSAYCAARGGDPEKHERTQNEINHDEAERDKQYRHERKRSQEELERQNTEMVMEWLEMPPEDRATRVEELKRKIAAQNANPPTMDYMVEFNREVAARKMWETELKFHRAVQQRESK
jgi:hypothetical protein